MIEVTPTAQDYFRRLIENQGGDTLGVLLGAIDAGTPAGEVRLEFCEPDDLDGDEEVIAFTGFNLYLEGKFARVFDDARIDFEPSAVGGNLNIRAPRIKGDVPAADATLLARVRFVLDSEVNPKLAMHGGKAQLERVTAEGIVQLRFGGGCHGCGMVDLTMKNGVEKTLLAMVPGVTGVQDVTDHSTGNKPYYAAKK